MTSTEYFNAVCLHYGKASEHEGKPVREPRKYDDVIGKSVASWIRAQASKNPEFQPLFDKLTLTYSTTYGRLPDAVHMQTALDSLVPVVVPMPRQPMQLLTDEEREANAKALEEIYNDLKYGKRPERNDPYVDN